MKNIDLLSLFGLLVALAAIMGGNYLEGGEADSLWELTALIVVLGGTLGATMVQTPMPVFLHALRLLKWVLQPPAFEDKTFIKAVIRWSQIARREGLLGLEVMMQKEKNPFLKKCLQLLIDGNEPETIRNIMEVDLIAKEQRDIEAAKVYEGMGGYSPTIGILGAVMGLIHVMNNLEDPSKLGAGIATAFVATIYGVGFANLLFLPLAYKLKNMINAQSQFKELMLDGVIAIAEGDNPRNIENKLKSYF